MQLHSIVKCHNKVEWSLAVGLLELWFSPSKCLIHNQVHTEEVAPGKKFQCCLHGTENPWMERELLRKFCRRAYQAVGYLLEEWILILLYLVMVHVALYSLCPLAKELTCNISHARRWWEGIVNTTCQDQWSTTCSGYITFYLWIVTLVDMDKRTSSLQHWSL